MIFYVGVLGLCAGIVIASFTSFSYSFAIAFFILALLSFAFFVRAPRRAYAAAAIFFLITSLGGLRMESAKLELGELSQYIGEQVVLEGVVDAIPDMRDTNQRFPLVLENGEKVSVSTDLYKTIRYGDLLRVSGMLKHPEPFETNTGRIFDYASYLAKDGIGYTMNFAQIDIVDRDKGSPVIATLFSLNGLFQRALGTVLSEPHASLGGGITIGAKESLGEEILEDFRAVGLIHIVVLSGYNVMIVAEWIMRSVSFLPLSYSLGIGGLAIALFALLTGAGATVVRASIMALLALIARATGRTYAITRALFIAGALMLLHNPYLLLFDPSFQLSFIASLGLIHGAPIIARFIPWVTERFMIREIVSATISTQIAVLPLMMYSFGNVSLIALPANLLVLPTVPFAMGATLLTALTSWIPFLGFVLSTPAYLLLSYTLWIVELFASLPFAQVLLPPISVWVMVIAYGLLFFLFTKLRSENAPRIPSNSSF
jgi:competence protein ComEC